MHAIINSFFCLKKFVHAVIFLGDVPCALRDYGNSHKVCVCNATYCDTITRVNSLKSGDFVAIISSKEGLRFNKTHGKLARHRLEANQSTLSAKSKFLIVF